MSKLVLIRGMIGVGKSTVANMLHSYGLGNTVLLPKDTFAIDIIKDNSELYQAMKDSLMMSIRRFLEEDAVVIVEGPMYSDHWNASIDRVVAETNVSLHSYFLKLDHDEAVKRSSQREKADVVNEAFVREWNRKLESTYSADDIVIDVSNMSALEVSEEIASGIGIKLDTNLEKRKVNSGSYFRV